MPRVQERIIVAVDGGGTGCRVAVGTVQTGILFRSEGGPANVATAFETAISNIRAVVEGALAGAGYRETQLSDICAHVGVAGANSVEMMHRVAKALPYGISTASGDRETTVVGALEAQDGFVVALGTGTIIARQQAEQIRTVGGWGFHISDQAAGAWLGRRLLEDVLNAADGIIPHSPLSQQVLDQHGGVQGVVDFAAAADPGEFAKHAREIVDAAKQEDTVAVRLMKEGARHIELGLDALKYDHGEVLVLGGGLGPSYRDWLTAPYCAALGTVRGTALDGAFAMACRSAESAG